MKQSTPPEIVEHQDRFHADAWRQYTLAELGNAVAFFVKRAGHRTERAKAEKDLTDAQNYLAMMRQHVEDAQLKLGPGLSEQG